MIKLANYISKIEISSLWSGHKHIVWQLRPDVNVLSGHNGAGKSTILNRLIQHLRTIPTTGEIQGNTRFGVKIDFDPSDATGIHYDVIRSFDRQMVNFKNTSAISDARIVTELDWQLYLIQRRYLDYQVNVGNRMISLLTSGDPEAREKATEAANLKTNSLPKQANALTVKATNSHSFNTTSSCLLICSQAVKSRFCSFCSQPLRKTNSTTCSLWTNQRPAYTLSGKRILSHWCANSIPTHR